MTNIEKMLDRVSRKLHSLDRIESARIHNEMFGLSVKARARRATAKDVARYNELLARVERHELAELKTIEDRRALTRQERMKLRDLERRYE